MVPDYIKPISYDARLLADLIGAREMTPYPDGIVRTLDWIAAIQYAH